jgi:hypothetical protein
MDAKVLYRQNDFETAREIAESLGYRSGFAHSHTLRMAKRHRKASPSRPCTS